MPTNLPISGLPSYTTPIGTDILPIEDMTTSTAKKLSLANLWVALKSPEGTMINGRIAVSVASNNLTVALKTNAGTDPSATDPVYVMIGGVVRTITAALSVTVNAAANSFNAGSAELATKEIDYPAFLSYNATDGVILAYSRYFGTIFSDFSATATNEKYVACSNSHSAASDPFVVIGRFAATLSAGAGYTWSVPTFTASNLIQRPIYETRWLNWVPTWTSVGGAFTNVPANTAVTYKIVSNNTYINLYATYNSTSGGSQRTIATLPFTPLLVHTAGFGTQIAAIYSLTVDFYNGSNTIYFGKYDGNTCIVNGNDFFVGGNYQI